MEDGKWAILADDKIATYSSCFRKTVSICSVHSEW